MEFQLALEELRVVHALPMTVGSGARCPRYDAQVHKQRHPEYEGETRNGPHTRGAVDIVVRGADCVDLLARAIELGWKGFGVNQKGEHHRRFLHLDRRPRLMIWSY